jgi:hypothetical protein
MSKVISSEAIVFSDGYGGMAVLDVSKTHKDIIQFMKDESTWEVFDDVSKKPKGKYKAVFSFWWESNFPECGDELVIDFENMQFTQLN